MVKKNPFEAFHHAPKKNSLGGKYRLSWIEEALDVNEDPSGRLNLAHTKNFLGQSIDSKKITYFLATIVLGIVILLGRVTYLQVYKGGYYRAMAEGNRIRLQPIPSERGIIYDRFNRELVQNVPNFSLAIVPQDLPRDKQELERVVTTVAKETGVEVRVITDLLKRYKNYSYDSLIIKENVDYQTALKLYIKNAALPGVVIERGSQRHYLTSMGSATSTLSLSHILGYLGKLNEEELERLRGTGYLPSDNIGKVGVEKQYETELRGAYGQKKIEVNAAGKEQEILAVAPPAPGKNLILTIDKDAQEEMERLVKNMTAKLSHRRVSAVAMDPNTGAIVAMVSWPSFDNNAFSGGIDQKTFDGYNNDRDRPLFNRSISGGYPPGSTMKLVVAAAALEEKIITKNTTVNSVGGFVVGGHFFKDWLAGGHGITNVTKSLALSINTFYYYVGGGYKDFEGLGITKIVKYFHAFGLGAKTGIDLPNESPGAVPTPEWKEEVLKEKWYIGDTYNVSIGEGNLLVTPLQNAVWTAAIANGGKVVTPHLVKTIIDPETKKEIPIELTPPKDTGVYRGNINIVREGMRDCVSYGSCRSLQSLPFTSAGKTGTAQWNTNFDSHAWFTSFAPYENPKIVVTVLVEEAGEGSVYAKPIAQQFLTWWGKKYLTQ